MYLSGVPWWGLDCSAFNMQIPMPAGSVPTAPFSPLAPWAWAWRSKHNVPNKDDVLGCERRPRQTSGGHWQSGTPAAWQIPSVEPSCLGQHPESYLPENTAHFDKQLFITLTRRFVVQSLIVSDSLWPSRLQHARLPCPSLSPGVCPNSCPLSWWCHPAISSSVIPFSSCP